MTKSTLKVNGMDCTSCANIVQKTISKTPGVTKSQVSFATETASIEFDPGKTSLNTINENVKKYGYSLQIEGSVITPQESGPSSEPALFLFPISLLIFFLMIYDTISSLVYWLPPLPLPMAVFDFITFILATITLFVFGREFLSAVARFFVVKTANMDTLIGLGSLTAYIYSTLVFLIPSLSQNIGLPPTKYFDVVIIVIGFIKFGKFLEASSKQKTGEAIKNLLKLSAKTAIVERNHQEIEIPIEEVRVGDIVIVKPGAKIPVDGQIIEGDTSIDESTITGEPLPVDKTINDLVTSGTINNQGYIKFSAVKVGSDTLLSQIIKTVENAQNTKAPIEKLADIISAKFVPAVLLISITSFVTWIVSGNISLAISSFVGVLVIACPCALGLATPTAIIVGVGKGAQNGILIKDAEVLENLHKTNVIVFDKTGTITTGNPKVQEVISVSQMSESQILGILSSLEKRSDHPLAKAILAHHPSSSKTSLTHFQDLPGKGVTGKIDKVVYYAGNTKLMSDLSLKLPTNIQQKFTSKGMTPVFLSTKKEILGAVFISDNLKDETKTVINNLRKMKIKTIMITGDDKETANYIAKEAGIDTVYSEVLPTNKAQIIQEIKSQGHKVTMVGDGVNDSPALTVADVGIAMSTGTDIAIQSASITLIHGDLSKVERAITLSRKTMSTVKQNLFWAFLYNVLLIPLAAGALHPFLGITLNPALAGAAMAFSSVSVVTNSLRLKTLHL